MGLGSLLGSLLGGGKSSRNKTPFAEIKIGSSVWKTEAAGITNVEVDMGVDGKASTCSIDINGSNRVAKKDKIDISSDFGKIKIGEKIEISMGYMGSITNDTSTVFKGFICDVDIEVDRHGTLNVYITGMDGKMWLMPSQKTQDFGEKQAYSDAVRMVYKDNSSYFSGLSVDSTGKLPTNLYMCNESYYDFCMRAANVTGNYFYVYLGILCFEDLSKHKSAKRTIKLSPEVRRVRVRSSPFGIPKSVEVHGIDEKDSSKMVKSTAKSVSAIGSGKDASGLSNNVKGEIIVYDEGINSSSGAKELAESILVKRALNLVETEIEIDGDPSIALGAGLKLSGFGKPMDNEYIVTNVHHMCNFSKNDYKTVIRLSANKHTPLSGGLGGLF